VWMPLAPAGYTAMGCVAAMGKEPPHLSTVYCVRSDLLTSSFLSDCVFFPGPVPQQPPGKHRVDTFFQNPSLSSPRESTGRGSPCDPSLRRARAPRM